MRIAQSIAPIALGLLALLCSCAITPAQPRTRTDPVWSALLLNQLIEMGRPGINPQPIGVIRCMPDGIGGTTCYGF